MGLVGGGENILSGVETCYLVCSSVEKLTKFGNMIERREKLFTNNKADCVSH